MRLLYVDIDTLRADHLGCYGYGRPTTPTIDALAAEGVRFTNTYVSDAPCLPSRTALSTGRFGLHTGVVNHGGAAADLAVEGPGRVRQTEVARSAWAAAMRSAGMRTATISTFAERHSAFHWYAGFHEAVNLGTSGMETADEIGAAAVDWIRRRGREDDWFLHVHFWDPHTPYRTPAAFGDPFAGAPLPGWLTEEVRRAHWELPGPHSAQEPTGYGDPTSSWPRQPSAIDGAGAVRAMFDGYDTGIRYADDHVGRLLEELSSLGVLDDTAVLVSSDHGETLGELGIYCDHQTADHQTQRVPAVLRWPGIDPGTDDGLHYQIDLAATVLELLGVEVPGSWDGTGFADGLRRGATTGRDHLVVSCAAWAVQRAVRWGSHLAIRTYDDAYHGFPETMVFDVEADPHQTTDLAPDRPDLVARADDLRRSWLEDEMSSAPQGVDPLRTVLEEGGGLYVRGRLPAYADRLRATGRSRWADELLAR